MVIEAISPIILTAQLSGTSPDIAKPLKMPEHHGLRLVALGDQVLQLGDFRRDIDRLGIRAGLDIAADVEVVICNLCPLGGCPLRVSRICPHSPI